MYDVVLYITLSLKLKVNEHLKPEESFLITDYVIYLAFIDYWVEYNNEKNHIGLIKTKKATHGLL